MKKFLLLGAMGITFLAHAQDFKKAKNSAILGQVEASKTEIDKAMADAKAQTKAEGWFWKGYIYSAIYKDNALSTKYPKADLVADEAFQKYFALEPSLAILKDNNGQNALFALYVPAFNNGIAAFTAKKWDSAYYYFSFSAKYGDVIFPNKFGTNQNQTFDTTSIMYAGVAAQNGHHPDSAVKFYERLIGYKLVGPDYLDIYKYCMYHAIETKDNTAFTKYLNASKELFPKEDFEDYENTFFMNSYSLAEKSSRYDKEDAGGTLTAKKYLQYGEAFANIPKEEKEKLDSATQELYIHKAADAFSKAATKNPEDGIAAFNAGLMFYNIFVTLDDKSNNLKRSLQEINTARAGEKDPKKKAALDATFKIKSESIKTQRVEIEKPLPGAIDSSILFLEKSYTLFKDKATKTNNEKNCLNKSVDFLANLYSYKRDKARGKDVKAFDIFDAQFKKYDDLHGKF